jgi:hypothetical protein
MMKNFGCLKCLLCLKLMLIESAVMALVIVFMTILLFSFELYGVAGGTLVESCQFGSTPSARQSLV